MAGYIQKISHHETREDAEKRIDEVRDYYWGYGPRLVEITREQDGKWRCHIEMMDSCD
jgi:hypothetical protein